MSKLAMIIVFNSASNPLITCHTCEINVNYSFCPTLACGCSLFGSVREDCEQMTGRCVCKPDIQGQKCTICNDHNKILTPTGCYAGIKHVNR